MKKILDIVGGILALLTVATYGLLFIHNGIVAFLPTNIAAIMESIRPWAVLLVCAITGLEFAISTKSFFIQLFVIILLAITVIAMFFPNALASVGIVF